MTGQIVQSIISAMTAMKSITDVFKCWDTVPGMALDVGESHWTVQKWKSRKRIPQDAWAAVIKAVHRKGKRLTADDLLLMHSSATSRRSGGVAACK